VPDSRVCCRTRYGTKGALINRQWRPSAGNLVAGRRTAARDFRAIGSCVHANDIVRRGLSQHRIEFHGGLPIPGRVSWVQSGVTQLTRPCAQTLPSFVGCQKASRTAHEWQHGPSILSSELVKGTLMTMGPATRPAAFPPCEWRSTRLPIARLGFGRGGLFCAPRSKADPHKWTAYRDDDVE
jgi:hypothetical protein